MHYTENQLSGTLTYLKDSTMAETIPVTIITIPRTQKRPVHEVKSTLVWKQKMVTEMDTTAVMIIAMMTALV